VAAAALALAGLALPALFNGGAPHTGPRDTLRIALSSTPHASLLHLAAAQGYFAEEGLDVMLLPVSHGKAALELLAQGRADVAAAAEVPFVIAVLKGEPLGIAASIASTSTEMAVVGRRDRAIGAPRDLAGKKIGITQGTSGDYFLWAFLIRNKLAPDLVTMVDVPPGRIVQSLADGQLDAVTAWEPLRHGAQAALQANAVSFAEPDAYTVTHVVVGRNDFLRGHAAAVQKLIRATLKAERFVYSHPQQARALIAERLSIAPQALQPNWNDLELRVELHQSQLVTLEDEARWAMTRGYAERREVPNFLPHLYLDALLAVQPQRVTVVH
jgi:NitT/TauT family transport system substrate-binding protein